jgi:formylglycine-generating enzyme required for sulfatase activity
LALVAGGVGALTLFVIAAIGLFVLFGRSTTTPGNGSSDPTPDASPVAAAVPIERKLIPVKGGTFSMGSNDVDDKLGTWGDQYPAHSETVGDLSIDAYEITNFQYSEFVKATGHKRPDYWTSSDPPKDQENRPVTNVSLADAKAFAAWVTQKDGRPCRLPTEAEWEYVARNGSKATLYPWGGDANTILERSVLKGRDAVIVGTSKDVTDDGIYDMLGNVTEWTSSPYVLYKGHPATKKFPGLFVVRGLNFNTPSQYFEKPQLLLTFRQAIAETPDGKNFIGFRLVCE